MEQHHETTPSSSELTPPVPPEPFDRRTVDKICSELNYGSFIAAQEKLEQLLEKTDPQFHQTIAEAILGRGAAELFNKSFHLFRELTPEPLIEKLIESLRPYEAGVVLSNFEFETVSPSIAWKLIDRDMGVIVLQYLEKFPGLEERAVVLAMIKKESTNAIFQSLYKLTCLDHELALLLIEGNASKLVATNLEYFHDLNYQEIVQKLIEKNQGIAIVQNLEKFPMIEAGVFKKLVESGVAEAAVFKLEEISNDLFETIYSLCRDDERSGFLPGAFSKRLKNAGPQAAQFYAERHRFRGLGRTMELFDEPFPFDEAGAKKQLQSLVGEQNFFAAREFISCMKAAGQSVDEGGKATVLQEAALEDERRGERKPRDVNTAEKVIANEMVRFYVNDSIKLKLKEFEKRIAKATRQVSFRTSMDMFNLLRTIEREEQELFRWMREYLVVAVESELGNQRPLFSPQRDVKIPTFSGITRHGVTPVDTLLRYGTEEEIRQYLFEAALRFREPGWTYKYGGESWAKIAEVARKFWQKDALPPSVLIDLTFDLEHNTGMVFNKQPSRIRESEHDKTLLDAKRDASDFKELLEKFDPYLSLSPEMKQQVETRVAQMNSIELRVS